MSHPVTHKDLAELESRLMSALSDAIAKQTQAIADAEARVNARIDALEAGQPTPDELKAIDANTARVEALAPVTTAKEGQ